MFTGILSPISQLLPCAIATLVFLQPAQLRAQAQTQAQAQAQVADSAAPPAVSAAPGAVCALFEKQLRWHEPFFGVRSWPEVAQEALAYASPACRDAIATGKAPEVATALAGLAKHAETAEVAELGGKQLRRFTYRLACQLRVPEARPQILAGVREPGTYADCADALFTMQWSEREALQLREEYLEGLQKEPLKTHIPSGVLHPPYVERLVPVLRAYDQAEQRGRDAIYRALCVQTAPVSAEAKAACAGMSEREPEWIKNKLLGGKVEAGLDDLGGVAMDRLPQFSTLLKKFDEEKRPGRDRLYGLLCLRHPPQAAPLRDTCDSLPPRAEPKWLAIEHAQSVNDELEVYRRGGRLTAGAFLVVSLLLMGHRMLTTQRRRYRRA